MEKYTPILLSTAYLPPISYFSLIQQTDYAIIEQLETYQKQTYRNRCEIYSEKGKMALTIPVSKPYGNHTQTKDIRIFNQDKWYIKHWRAIETAYLSAPFFIYYKDEIETFFKKPFELLLDFNTQLTRLLCRILGLETTITLSEEFVKIPEGRIDYRTALSPKKQNIFTYFPEYTQVFGTEHGFIPDLSILDLIFNLGPESYEYVLKMGNQTKF